MKTYLSVAFLLYFSFSACAEFWDGNKMIPYMREHEKVNRGERGDFQKAALYSGYVLGVHDSNQDLICTPPNANAGQITNIVSKYMNEHPEKWSEPASTLALHSLRLAFPCPKN